MDWIKSLQHTIDYIEEHITEPTDYRKIASEMNVSEYYFHKIFTAVCGFTPGEYIRSRRLALAGSELLSTDSKVIDIAMKYGYDSPEGFTRAFTRFHGAAPNTVRKGKASVRSFSSLHISVSLKGGKSMNYKIIKKEEFTVLEKVEVHSIVDDENKNTIPDFWDRAKVDGTVKTLAEALTADHNNLMGICYGNSPSDSKNFEYSIAAICDENCPVPEGYRKNKIPARTWAVFECTGPMPKAIQEAWHKIITEFFPMNDFEPTYEMDIEDYPDGDVTSENYKTYIWVAVKSKKE